MLFLPTLIVASVFSLHPLHVAYTNIEINKQEKKITVAHKIFTNDFTLLFFHLFEKNIEPRKDIEFTDAENALINSYMKERFILTADHDTILLKYVDKAEEDESLWLYYKGKLEDSDPKDLAINNMLLLDLYMDQTNLVIVNIGTDEKGLTFNWDKRQSVLDIREE